MRIYLAFGIAVLGLSSLASDAAAQQRATNSSASARSGGASGSSMFGSGSARGNASRGAGMQGGASSAIGNNGQMQLGNGAQTSGSERFMRGNRQSGNFVGSDVSEVTQLFSNLTAGRAGSDGAGNFGPQQRGGQGDFNNQQNQSNSTIIPHRLVVNFRYQPPRISLPAANSQGGITIRGLSRVQSRGPVAVELQDRTAILRGVVGTSHDRELAEQLALLEPGVSRVRNELTVAEPLPAVAPATSPALQP